MEEKRAYFHRFINNTELVELFPDIRDRKEMSKKMWTEKWEEAPVIVRLANGDEFFID